MGSTKVACSLLAGLLAAATVLAADAAPADKQSFKAQPVIYLRFELTEVGTLEFGTAAAEALTDAAYHFTRTVSFEVPMNKPMPDACPISTVAASSNPVIEHDRCIGWMATTPAGASPLPVAYAIDDVHQFRHRDTSSDAFATETTTIKGHGIATIARSGMLMCDLGKMTCDVNNVVAGYQNGTDVVDFSKTSTVPGFAAKKETVGPAMMLPTIPGDLAKQLDGFALTLPLPMVKTLTGTAAGGQGTVTIKVTLSTKPAANAPASPK